MSEEYKLWQLYHLNSRLNPRAFASESNNKPNVQCQKSSVYKNFPSWNLDQNFIDCPDFSFISELLQSSYSLRTDVPGKRTAPSAGALYPIDIYFSLDIDADLLNGIYYYNVEENCIYQIKKIINHKSRSNLFIQDELINAKVIIYFVANFIDINSRYGERGYRFALLEAGHIAQNFNLNAIRLNAAFKNVGGYYEQEINILLNLDGLDASCIYCMAIF